MARHPYGSDKHRAACKAHCATRLVERYGVYTKRAGKSLYVKHRRMVMRGASGLLGVRKKDGSEILEVRDGDRSYFLAWDPELKLTKTYLTEQQAFLTACLAFLL